MAQSKAGSQRREEEIPAATQTGPPLDATYVLTLEKIGNLAAEGGKPSETLTNVGALFARRFKTDVCSAYLLEPDRINLLLSPTLELRPQCVCPLRIAVQQALTSTVAH